MDYSIRPYYKDDFERICQIHDSARIDELRFADLVEAFIPFKQAAENENFFDYTVSVAESAGKPVGFVAFKPGELGWLYVCPSFYRCGIASHLTRHVVNTLGSNIHLEVLEGNDPAYNLYLRNGFRFVERVSGKMAGNDAFDVTVNVMEYLNQ